MSIDLSERGSGYHDLKAHVGHAIVCVAYGDVEDPVDVTIECIDCGEVLVSFNEPEEAINCCPHCRLHIKDKLKETYEGELFQVGDIFSTICPECNEEFKASKSEDSIEFFKCEK